MDFFEHQDKAKRGTSLLVFYFSLAVLCTFVALYGLASFLLSRDPYTEKIVWDLGLAFKVGLGTLLVVGLGSLYKIGMLSGGGKVVAESLGGTLLCPNTKDLTEKRVLNVVEEMAIASGCPVPPVYMMEEKAINAFAAGYSPENAVVGVTRGCAEKLNRDQLQGVMAHEFSHILNGDMRLSIRLIGVLHGILLIAGIGYFLMRISPHLMGGRRNKEGGGLGVALLVAGLGILIIGYVGAFFGGLIKAAVSRQREFLADASAVQFTRNPEGISGALKRIGGLSAGSKLETPNASECSHLFFGSALSSLFATHPPLDKRIRRIEPNWKGDLPDTDSLRETPHASEFAGTSGFASKQEASPAKKQTTPPHASPPESSPPAAPPPSAQALQAAGAPTPEQVERAEQTLAEIPKDLLDLAREPFGARCVIYALLLDGSPNVRDKQLAFLSAQTETGTDKETEKAAALLPGLNAERKFTLVELASPALAHLSPGQFASFRSAVDQLAAADQRLDLFEWSLRKVIDHDLTARFSPPRPLHGTASAKKLLPDCLLVLGSLAHHGQEGADPEPAFRAGLSALTRGNVSLPSSQDCSIASLDAAVKSLARLRPLEKRAFLEACSRTIDHDGKTTDVETQTLRGVAAALSCRLGPTG